MVGRMARRLTITAPDDWHLHLRDGDALATLVPATARQMQRAIVMPNLTPPLTTTEAALQYRQRILDARPPGSTFQPLMTLYLTDSTPPEEVRRAKESGFVHAFKLYPAGATTNSDSGVTDIAKVRTVLAAMQAEGVTLCLHGEVTTPGVDIFDRERVFVEKTLPGVISEYPELPVVLEHITTAEAAQYVAEGPSNLAATITPQHLLVNRNAMLAGGIRPHLYCLPILKREEDRVALVKAATSGDPKYFLGTDSAPHAIEAKETACGCAGCFTASHALELYAEAFDDADALDKLEGFASHYGPDFYRLPRNPGVVTLVEESAQIPESILLRGSVVRPFRAGGQTRWRLA